MPCHNYTYEYFINRNHLTKKIVQLFFIYHYIPVIIEDA